MDDPGGPGTGRAGLDILCPVTEVTLHSTADARRPASLLLGRIPTVLSLVAPRRPAASTGSMLT